MTIQVTTHICSEDRPPNLPDFATIVTQYRKLLPEQTDHINYNGVRMSLEKQSDLDVSDIWVKLVDPDMGEARTQHYVVEYLRTHSITSVRAPRVYLAFVCGPYGYIVSEFIDGKMVENSDEDVVAAVVQELIRIPPPSPDLVPGPVGGGLIEHPFFVDGIASFPYRSVKELQKHINRILAVTERTARINFTPELSNGLILCLSDIKTVNFMRDNTTGGIVAVDFGGYSYLPPSFFTLATEHKLCSGFAYCIAQKLDYPRPPPENVSALLSASYAMVPFNTNWLGVSKRRQAELGYSL